MRPKLCRMLLVLVSADDHQDDRLNADLLPRKDPCHRSKVRCSRPRPPRAWLLCGGGDCRRHTADNHLLLSSGTSAGPRPPPLPYTASTPHCRAHYTSIHLSSQIYTSIHLSSHIYMSIRKLIYILYLYWLLMSLKCIKTGWLWFSYVSANSFRTSGISTLYSVLTIAKHYLQHGLQR